MFRFFLSAFAVIVAGCASAPVERAPASNLPPAKISKETAEPSKQNGTDKIQVSTVIPKVGQKVAIQAVINNKHAGEISIHETFMGDSRDHVLKPGETLDVTYEYLRKMVDHEVAQYQVIAKSEPGLISGFILKEDKEGFSCVGQNFRGPGCKVLPSDKKGSRIPSFRLSIPYGQ